MNKQEFIDRLRAALVGRILPNLVQEHVNYYEDYINTQIRMGRSEQEVLGTLGDPRLIAKTIIETSGQDRTGNYENAGYQNEGYRNTGYQNVDYQNQGNTYIKKGRTFHIPGWLWIIIVLLVLVLVLGVVFSVLSFFAPAIVTILVVVFLVKLFRDWLN